MTPESRVGQHLASEKVSSPLVDSLLEGKEKSIKTIPFARIDTTDVLVDEPFVERRIDEMNQRKKSPFVAVREITGNTYQILLHPHTAIAMKRQGEEELKAEVYPEGQISDEEYYDIQLAATVMPDANKRLTYARRAINLIKAYELTNAYHKGVSLTQASAWARADTTQPTRTQALTPEELAETKAWIQRKAEICQTNPKSLYTNLISSAVKADPELLKEVRTPGPGRKPPREITPELLDIVVHRFADFATQRKVLKTVTDYGLSPRALREFFTGSILEVSTEFSLPSEAVVSLIGDTVDPLRNQVRTQTKVIKSLEENVNILQREKDKRRETIQSQIVRMSEQAKKITIRDNAIEKLTNELARYQQTPVDRIQAENTELRAENNSLREELVNRLPSRHETPQPDPKDEEIRTLKEQVRNAQSTIQRLSDNLETQKVINQRLTTSTTSAKPDIDLQHHKADKRSAEKLTPLIPEDGTITNETLQFITNSIEAIVRKKCEGREEIVDNVFSALEHGDGSTGLQIASMIAPRVAELSQTFHWTQESPEFAFISLQHYLNEIGRRQDTIEPTIAKPFVYSLRDTIADIRTRQIKRNPYFPDLLEVLLYTDTTDSIHREAPSLIERDNAVQTNDAIKNYLSRNGFKSISDIFRQRYQKDSTDEVGSSVQPDRNTSTTEDPIPSPEPPKKEADPAKKTVIFEATSPEPKTPATYDSLVADYTAKRGEPPSTFATQLLERFASQRGMPIVSYVSQLDKALTEAQTRGIRIESYLKGLDSLLKIPRIITQLEQALSEVKDPPKKATSRRRKTSPRTTRTRTDVFVTKESQSNTKANDAEPLVISKPEPPTPLSSPVTVHLLTWETKTITESIGSTEWFAREQFTQKDLDLITQMTLIGTRMLVNTTKVPGPKPTPEQWQEMVDAIQTRNEAGFHAIREKAAKRIAQLAKPLKLHKFHETFQLLCAEYYVLALKTSKEQARTIGDHERAEKIKMYEEMIETRIDAFQHTYRPYIKELVQIALLGSTNDERQIACEYIKGSAPSETIHTFVKQFLDEGIDKGSANPPYYLLDLFCAVQGVNKKDHISVLDAREKAKDEKADDQNKWKAKDEAAQNATRKSAEWFSEQTRDNPETISVIIRGATRVLGSQLEETIKQDFQIEKKVGDRAIKLKIAAPLITIATHLKWGENAAFDYLCASLYTQWYKERTRRKQRQNPHISERYSKLDEHLEKALRALPDKEQIQVRYLEGMFPDRISRARMIDRVKQYGPHVMPPS